MKSEDFPEDMVDEGNGDLSFTMSMMFFINVKIVKSLKNVVIWCYSILSKVGFPTMTYGAEVCSTRSTQP